MTLIRVREHGREHTIILEGSLGPGRRKALADRFGLEEGRDIWFFEREAEGSPGSSGVLSLGPLPAGKKSG